jgi:hypothetical protein
MNSTVNVAGRNCRAFRFCSALHLHTLLRHNTLRDLGQWFFSPLVLWPQDLARLFKVQMPMVVGRPGMAGGHVSLQGLTQSALNTVPSKVCCGFLVTFSNHQF